MWRLALTVLCCGYLILFSSKHYAWGCLVAHIHIYTCLCITMSVYIDLRFHCDGKQSWKTPVRVLKTLQMGRNGDWVLIAHSRTEGVEKGEDRARVMMALTDRQLYRRTDPRSGFFPVYRSWLPARPLLEALLLAQEMGSASRHRATAHSPC